MKKLLKYFQQDQTDATFYQEISVSQSRQLIRHKELAQKLSRLGIACLVILFIWAAFAPVPQAARGSGKVVPSKRLQIVQVVDGGVLTDIVVSEGELVKKGQIIAQIDTTRFSSSLQEKEAIEASLRLREERLISLLNGSPFTPDPQYRQRFPELYAEEMALLNSTRQEWQAQTQIYTEQLAQRQRELEEAQSRAIAAQQAADLLDIELKQVKPLLRTGAVSQMEVLRIDKQIAQAQGDLSASQAQSRRLESAIQEARKKIQETSLQLENKVRAELSEVKGKLASLSQNKVELSDRVEQATLRAPVSGQVQRVLYNTKGAVVPPGQEILEIVPFDDLLVFETRIDPKDIGFIRPDQEATVRVTAYDYTIYGALKGRVQNISADSLQDEKGNPFYSVKVIVDKENINSNLDLIPGMIAEVSIRTADRTVLSYLTKPLRRGISQAFTER